MIISDPARRALEERLQEAVGRSRRGRLTRVLSHPQRTAYLRWLRATGRVREVGVQTFFGRPMKVVLPEHVSTSIWQYGFAEPEVCICLLSTLAGGGGFVDIGAHYGFFTLLAAHLVGEHGRVLAVEPSPATYQVLQKNVAAYPNVEARSLAAFNEAKQTVMYDYGVEFSAFNSLLGIRPPGGRGPTSRAEVLVQGRRVDDLLDESGWCRVDVIKIDAESSEWYVLQGLEKTICRFRPAVILEVGDYDIPGSVASRRIIDWFDEQGYAVFEIGDSGIRPHRAREHYEHANLLFMTKRQA